MTYFLFSTSKGLSIIVNCNNNNHKCDENSTYHQEVQQSPEKMCYLLKNQVC